MGKRILLAGGWLGSLALAYLLGASRVEVVEAPEPAVAAPVMSLPAPTPSDVFGELVLRGDWQALARWAVGNGGLERLTNKALGLAGTGRSSDAVELLEAYVALEPMAAALFALSDVQLLDGNVTGAVESLVSILDYPETPAIASDARTQLDLLVAARETQLLSAGDLAGLVDFFEYLSLREPGYDGHRLSLVRWLLRSGAVEEATNLYREVGYVGVDDAQMQAVGREIALAGAEFPIQREGGAFYTQALGFTPGRGEQTLRLLVDTGATTTSLSLAALVRLDARRLGERVRVHTANGVTVLERYRVYGLTIGGLEFAELDVLALPDPPRTSDGLLGMDVLDQLLKPVGTPWEAR